MKALNLYQIYDFNKTLAPAKSNDYPIWTSSDNNIAKPNKNGRFKTQKVGEVTLTAKTLSGATDKVTFKVVDKDGTVTTQKELEELLGSGVAFITIKTDAEINLTIPEGDYSTQALVVDAPNADITNHGVFKSIDIKNIKSDTWYEEAVGNLLNILASKSRVVIGENAKANIEVTADGAVLTIENNGVIEKIEVKKPADIDISGDSKDNIPVVVNVPNIKITTSVSLNLEVKEKMELVLLEGSEKTQVQADTEEVIPEIKGSVTIDVKVGTGENQTTKPVTGTPITTPTPTPPSTPYIPSDPGTVTPEDITVVENSDGSISYKSGRSYKELTGITVSYVGLSYTLDSGILTTLKDFLAAEDATITKWVNTTSTTKTYTNGIVSQEVTVTAVPGDQYTKTVSFTSGSLTGKSYLVTLGTAGTVTVKSITTNNTYIMARSADEKTLTFDAAPAGLTFTPSFN